MIEPAITTKTKAILCVHQLGMPCDLARIVDIGRRRGLPVIEDAACAIGSEILGNGQWEKIGKPHGDVACFSFHPRKVITTGDGGMLTTANPEYDQKFRLWRQHSMSVPDTVRHGAPEVIFESYPEVGFNYRMTDLQAAVGREQLQRLPEIMERRRAVADRYRQLLQHVDQIQLPFEPAWCRSNWQSFAIRLDDGLDQRSVMQTLLDAGVSTRRGVMCAHLEPAYSHEPWRPGTPDGLLESEAAQQHALILPLYTQMTDADQVHVAESLRRAIADDSAAPRSGPKSRSRETSGGTARRQAVSRQ